MATSAATCRGTRGSTIPIRKNRQQQDDRVAGQARDLCQKGAIGEACQEPHIVGLKMRLEVLAGRHLSQPIRVGRSRNQHNITSVGLKACCKGKSLCPIVLADCARYFGPMRADCQR